MLLVVTTAVRLPAVVGLVDSVTVRDVAVVVVTVPAAPLLKTTVFRLATGSNPRPLMVKVVALVRANGRKQRQHAHFTQFNSQRRTERTASAVIACRLIDLPRKQETSALAATGGIHLLNVLDLRIPKNHMYAVTLRHTTIR
jgi:hypothetical protein